MPSQERRSKTDGSICQPRPQPPPAIGAGAGLAVCLISFCHHVLTFRTAVVLGADLWQAAAPGGESSGTHCPSLSGSVKGLERGPRLLQRQESAHHRGHPQRLVIANESLCGHFGLTRPSWESA